MVPPFLAYYGVATKDIGYLEEAVLQCQLYAEVLSTTIVLEDGQHCHGLWRHIVSDPAILEPGVCCSDPDVWLTSNAWAISGMIRVLATILHWQPPSDGPSQWPRYDKFRQTSRTTLANLIASMLQCTVQTARDRQTGLLRNYLDGISHRSASWAYGDAAGTALMASAVYRLAVLLPEVYAVTVFLGWADRHRQAVVRHIDRDGKVGPVADVGHVPSKSPVGQTSEGQSMVILMYSAWRDCVDARICAEDRSHWTTVLHSFTSLRYPWHRSPSSG
jgi:rhamnogalacturonyl hydrolase YesR